MTLPFRRQAKEKSVSSVKSVCPTSISSQAKPFCDFCVTLTISPQAKRKICVIREICVTYNFRRRRKKYAPCVPQSFCPSSFFPLPSSLSHHIPLPHRLPLPVLALQDHRAALEALGVVPLALGRGETPDVAVGGEEEGLREVAVVIVVVPAAPAAQHHHRLLLLASNYIKQSFQISIFPLHLKIISLLHQLLLYALQLDLQPFSLYFCFPF